MSTLDFNAFFQAVHGIEPLPWQMRLAKQVIEQQQWPKLIDLPTGTGKTACIDIALFHVAWCAAHGVCGPAARRIVFVVDRRIIVDAAFDRAERILKALENSQDAAVAAVAAGLEKLGGESPLLCQKLRGGMPRERGFALNPAQPMVITSTVDQIGSRLLFRGYGLRSYMQPVHAGLLGYDTLILVDEAHLAQPLMRTVAALIRAQGRAKEFLAPMQPVRIVSLSATPGPSDERFRLDADDLENRLIRERLTTRKLARLVEAPSNPSARLKTLFHETRAVYGEIGGPAPTVAVIVNRVRTARELASRLQAELKGNYDIKLVTGRSRPLDRDDLAKWLVGRVGSGRKTLPEDKGLIVVATQALEVGADLDFQGLVTECASLAALRQRFGRLDRLGGFKHARAAIVGDAESEDDPVYGAAAVRTWQWLNRIVQHSDGRDAVVDFSTAAIEEALRSADVRELDVQARESLQLTPAHVDLLCQTSPSPLYDPDVSALLHGFETQPAEVQVIWRDHIPARRVGQEWQINPGVEEFVNTVLSIMPPVSLEALSLPLYAVKAWLGRGSTPSALADVEGARVDDEDNTRPRNPSNREVWRLSKDVWEAVSPGRLRPGDTIAVPTPFGGCDQFGFAPESTEAVLDLAQRARDELKREKIAILTIDLLKRHVDPARHHDIENAWGALCDGYMSQASSAKELWSGFREAVGGDLSGERVPSDEPEVLTARDGRVHALVLRDDRLGPDDISDEDLSSSLTVPIPLEQHNFGVGRRARTLAVALGLSDRLQETLGRAGDTHDLGKADPRFQRMLRAGDDKILPGQLLAKGLHRVRRVQRESSERHEAYSVAILRKHPEILEEAPDAQLALYLVGSHHGRGRAQMPFKQDDGTSFTLTVDGQTVDFDGLPDLGALDSGWPTLFWTLNERYGPWGLAYLEAVLRLADGLQSQYEVRGAHRGK